MTYPAMLMRAKTPTGTKLNVLSTEALNVAVQTGTWGAPGVRMEGEFSSGLEDLEELVNEDIADNMSQDVHTFVSGWSRYSVQV